MTNEQLAQKYANWAQKCLAALKILIICAVAVIGVLAVFAAIAFSINMQESNPTGFLVGLLILSMLAVVCIICALIVLFKAAIAIKKLKNLGADKS